MNAGLENAKIDLEVNGGLGLMKRVYKLTKQDYNLMNGDKSTERFIK